MIQNFYSSINNGTAVQGDDKVCYKSPPLPLLRDNFLSEYRTELDKAKVRKNLGIADEATLVWGNISGSVENQTDLVAYLNELQSFQTNLDNTVTDIRSGLTFAINKLSTLILDSD